MKIDTEGMTQLDIDELEGGGLYLLCDHMTGDQHQVEYCGWDSADERAPEDSTSETHIFDLLKWDAETSDFESIGESLRFSDEEIDDCVRIFKWSPAQGEAAFIADAAD